MRRPRRGRTKRTSLCHVVGGTLLKSRRHPQLPCDAWFCSCGSGGARGVEAAEGDPCEAGLDVSSVVMASWMLHCVSCCVSCGRCQYRGKTPSKGAGFAEGLSRSGWASQWHLSQYLQDLMSHAAHPGSIVRLQHLWEARSSVRSSSTTQSSV